ncbi:hypothetical protein DL93DRAFT_213956 [Clavulina sp. PMI_390]|nr:hypothetical protein DL93DRAFT_213956 [Clavulina sp. PMI_390]
MSSKDGWNPTERLSSELLPTSSPQGRHRTRSSLPVRGLLATLFTITAISVLSTHRSLDSSYWTNVPLYAERVLSECEALLEVPGPAADFHQRLASDRFEPGTKHTLVTNATIWTGANDGKEVIHGGSILLENGVIKSVTSSSLTEHLLSRLRPNTNVVNAAGAWVTPAIVDIHSHSGVESIPALEGSADGNSVLGIAQPWLRSIDGIDTHDISWELARAGGIATQLILPGSANAIGGQAFAVKSRATKERSTLSMVLEPPNNIAVNGSSLPLRWRHIKHAAGENPSRVYSGTRMDTIWKFRESYNEARKVKLAQDAYCAKAKAGKWAGLADTLPTDLKWEALVDVLRGKVKVNVHIYETVDFTGIVGLSNEFKFPIAAFHHAHEAYLVPNVIKQAYGGVPAVAIFAAFARYKKESYRASEFAARILSDNGIPVIMKSDSPQPIHTRFLLHEAAQAHYYGLDEISALRSVTTVPADAAGLGHRVGYLKNGWDADLVIWDSHPLTLGSTPKQVFIDGIPQLSGSTYLTKPAAFQHAPRTPHFDWERRKALEYEGLPPLAPRKRVAGSSKRVAFTNVKRYWRKEGGEVKVEFGGEDDVDVDTTAALQTVVFEDGQAICVSSAAAATSCASFVSSATETVDLAGGSIVPGLTSFGSELGLTDIVLDPTTGDGPVHDPVGNTGTNTLLAGVEARASDGLLFGTRDALIAYRSGVTSAIAAPVSFGVFRGVSAAFSTSAADKLDAGALLKESVALHVSIGYLGTTSISTEIGLIRKGLLGGFAGTERGKWFEKVASGNIPLVVDVQRADHIVNLLSVKAEVEATTKSALKLVLVGAAEAHLVADHIASAGVSVVLLPTRQPPLSWNSLRALPGPPLTAESSVEVLVKAAQKARAEGASSGMRVGLGVNQGLGGWPVRNTRFDAGWVSLASNGTITQRQALAMASSEIDAIFGVEASTELVAYHGGDFTQFESKVVAIVSPQLGHVDIL